MPFDSILGMGRTPKITEDIKSNSFGLNSNISSGSVITVKLSSGGTSTGDTALITSDDFDSLNNIAYQYTTYIPSPGYYESILLLDLRKSVYIESLEVTGNYNKISGSGSGTFACAIEISNDNINYQFLSNIGAGLDTDIHYYKKFRFLRLRSYANYTSVTSAVTNNTQVRKIKIIMDSLQY